MKILDILTESTIQKIINEYSDTMVDGYGWVRFHDLIGILSDENPSKTLEILKKLTTVALNCIDDVSDRSLLYYVDDTEILEFLISRLSKNTICCTDEEHETVLIHSIQRNNVEKTEFILNNLPINVIEELLYYDSDLRTVSRGWNTLHYAVYRNMKGICELLISKIKQKNLGDVTVDGETPLHFAIRNGYTDIGILLIDKMTTEGIEIKNIYNETALHLAITKHNIDICYLLISKMSLEGLECCPDYSTRNPYKHADMEDLFNIRDNIRSKIKNLKYPQNTNA